MGPTQVVSVSSFVHVSDGLEGLCLHLQTPHTAPCLGEDV